VDTLLDIVKPTANGRLVNAVALSLALHCFFLTLIPLGPPRVRQTPALTVKLGVSVAPPWLKPVVFNPTGSSSSEEAKSDAIETPNSSTTTELDHGSGGALMVGPDETPLPPVSYFTVERLTRPPRIDVPPDMGTGLDGIEGVGVVVLQLWISEKGYVVDVIPVISELPSKFIEHTVNAFRSVRFHPGEIDGVAVRSVTRMEVSYEIRK
jgi:hypothetical protein